MTRMGELPDKAHFVATLEAVAGRALALIQLPASKVAPIPRPGGMFPS